MGGCLGKAVRGRCWLRVSGSDSRFNFRCYRGLGEDPGFGTGGGRGWSELEHKGSFFRREAGFTLVEVLVVLVVVGVLLGVAFFSLNRSAAHWDLVATARELVSHLRATRDLAVARGVESALTIYQKDNCYRFERTPGVWETVYLPARIRFAGLTFANPPVAGAVYEVRFDPSGSSGNGGTATLQSVTGEVKKIVVFGPTGRVRIK